MNIEQQMLNDLIEIMSDEYEKRHLITPQNTAEKLTEKGYRLATDVAREIFEEIEKVRMQHTFGNIDGSELNVRLYYLRKKYLGDAETP